MVRFKWLIVFGLLLIALRPSFADEREKILGVWKLVSWERETQATGVRRSPFGENPTGYRIFTPEGRMMVIITAEGRKAPNTEEARAALFDSMFAVTGIYRVERDRFITKIDVAWQPARIGVESEYSFKFEGDRLQLIGGWLPGTLAGRTSIMVRSIETWERAK